MKKYDNLLRKIRKLHKKIRVNEAGEEHKSFVVNKLRGFMECVHGANAQMKINVNIIMANVFTNI